MLNHQKWSTGVCEKKAHLCQAMGFFFTDTGVGMSSFWVRISASGFSTLQRCPPPGSRSPPPRGELEPWLGSGAWLKAKRLQHAKNLLLNSNLNVNEICFESGFINTAHFIKSFKDEYKLPPLKYRIQNTHTRISSS